MEQKNWHNELKEEFKMLGWSLLALYAFFQIWYVHESPFIVAKIIIAQAYLFIVPGFILMLYFKDSIEFIFRLLTGVVLGYSASILVTIYLNVFLQTNISNYYWMSPLIVSGVGLFIAYRKYK